MISATGWKSRISGTATTAVAGTISENPPTVMKSPWAKLISLSTPKSSPMPSAPSA